MAKGSGPKGRWCRLDVHRPRPWEEATNCIFCGSEGSKTPEGRLTQEHVFSRWTRRFVPRAMKGYRSLRATRHPDRTDFVFVSRRSGDLRDEQVRCVCSACNNGWMRQYVDERARPLLIPLVKGGSLRLLPAQQQIIATWAAMKAMVAEHGESEVATTHHMQRKYLMRHHQPPVNGWSVWIAHYIPGPNAPMIWSATPFLVLPDHVVAKRPDRRATYYNSQVNTQILGQLLIHVIRSPHPRLARMFRFKLPKRQALFRIWPPSEFSIDWPRGTIDDRSASYIGYAMMEFMTRDGAATT